MQMRSKLIFLFRMIGEKYYGVTESAVKEALKECESCRVSSDFTLLKILIFRFRKWLK